MYRLLTVAALSLALLLPARNVLAQQGEPLQKSDIVRLLTGTTYTKAEVAGIVRQSCLSFEPTARDLTDFRALGADDAVMGAIEACLDRPAPPPVASVQLSMDRRIFDAVVGDTVQIPFSVARSGAAEQGLRLRLEGSSGIRGGSGEDATAVTNASGRGVFIVPVGTAAGNVNMSVEAGVSLGGPTAVTIRVRAGRPAEASGSPDPLPLAEAESAVLRVEVRDRYGNPVPGTPVSVRAGDRTGAELFSGTTSDAGIVEGPVSAADLGGENRLAILSGSSVLGFTGAALPRSAAAAIDAASGAGQSADAGRALPSPLVVQVTDADGEPAPDVAVAFTATNGSVRPTLVRTDGRGRAAVSVTVGPRGNETIVTATAGEVSRSFTFPITIGGMTAAAMAAILEEASSLMNAGDHAGARELYERVAAADPSNLAAAIGVAESYSREGEYAQARERYRAILRGAPGRREAQLGMARASLGAGEPEDAARWFDVALSQDRNDVEALVGLGDARRRQGQRDQARAAYEEALRLDPESAAARAGLRRLADRPSVVEAEVWGGYTGDNGRDAGLRWGELRLYPAGGFELYGGYDDALNFRHPYLVRGRDDIQGVYGGVGYSYGEEGTLRTSFELGRREEPVDGTIQTTYTLDQTIGFESGSSLRLGGWLGHWFDRDDWVVFAEAGVPAGGLVVKPTLSYGDYFGSGLSEVPAGVPNRAPAKELRVGLGARFESEAGFGVEPGVAYGNVDSEVSDELSGSLWDATVRLWYEFSRTVRATGFFQYQTPPGLPDFWRAGLGFRFGIPR